MSAGLPGDAARSVRVPPGPLRLGRFGPRRWSRAQGVSLPAKGFQGLPISTEGLRSLERRHMPASQVTPTRAQRLEASDLGMNLGYNLAPELGTTARRCRASLPPCPEAAQNQNAPLYH